jgi:membrane associated rhomboid family serine protease
MAVCYRHPNRQTGVSCSSCGQPICPDCMTPTSVGMRCPECSREKTKVKTAGQVRQRAANAGGRYSMTQILIAVNVIAFLIETATGSGLGGTSGIPSALYRHFALDGPDIHFGHQYYRLLTGGFLHDGILHILFNMWFLYAVGPALERGIGRWNFLAIYLASLFAGSFGALLFEPRAYTVGASGALFGLLGALVVIANRRGISIWQSGLGATLVINIVFSLSIAGISIGGHIGGFVGGAICGWLYLELAERRRRQPLFWAGCAVVAVVSIGLALAVAGGTGLTPNGINLF